MIELRKVIVKEVWKQLTTATHILPCGSSDSAGQSSLQHANLHSALLFENLTKIHGFVFGVSCFTFLITDDCEDTPPPLLAPLQQNHMNLGP